MKEDKNLNVERMKRYLFLLNSLKEDKMLEKIDEKYLYYISLAKKEKKNNVDTRR